MRQGSRLAFTAWTAEPKLLVEATFVSQTPPVWLLRRLSTMPHQTRTPIHCLFVFGELRVHILQYTLIYDAILTLNWALLLLTAVVGGNSFQYLDCERVKVGR